MGDEEEEGVANKLVLSFRVMLSKFGNYYYEML